MPRSPKPPHCVLKRTIWWAKKGIPADCQHAFDGKKWLLANLHVRDAKEANLKSIPIVAEWERRIASVRAKQANPVSAEIKEHASAFRKLHQPLDDTGAALVIKVIEFVFGRIGGVATIEQHRLISQHRGDVAAAVAEIPAERRQSAVQALQTITSPDGATPYLAYLDDWQASRRGSKSTDQYVSSVRRFAAVVDPTLESLDGPQVQAFFDGLLKAGLSAATVRYHRAANADYWQWMRSYNYVPDRQPFAGRRIKVQTTGAERAETKRVRFQPVDVPRLWIAAEECGDLELFAAIQLSAFMGWRIEEVMRLRWDAVGTDRATGIVFIHGGLKTESGPRDLPLVPDIADLVARLAQRTDSDGYLIDTVCDNKWDKRSVAIGQRFSRFKRRLGYDHRHVFHSIRHCYAHLIAKARAPEHVIKALMGHEPGSVTAGYVGEIDLAEKLYWLKLAMRYPLLDARAQA
jgi:integrase